MVAARALRRGCGKPSDGRPWAWPHSYVLFAIVIGDDSLEAERDEALSLCGRHGAVLVFRYAVAMVPSLSFAMRSLVIAFVSKKCSCGPVARPACAARLAAGRMDALDGLVFIRRVYCKYSSYGL